MMMDLEKLREIFRDQREWIGLGRITKMAMAQDRSVLRCMVSLFPDAREIVTRMTWEHVGGESGIQSFPSIGDLVLVAYVDGEMDQAYIIKRLSSKEDKIPLRASEGDLVIKSLDGKKVWITSDTKIYLSEGDAPPTENLVLGQQLKELLVDVLTQLADLSEKVSTHTHSGNLGYPTSPPNQSLDFVAIQTEFDNLKASPVEDEAILSDIAFTEKGS